MQFFRAKAPDNSAAIAAANKQAEDAKLQAEQADAQRKDTQDQVVASNKARRKQAFQRFSLLTLGANDSTLG